MPKKIEAFYIVEENPEALAKRAAAYFAEHAARAAAARAFARIAISGGKTPKRMFELLAALPYRDQVPWNKIELFWVDERMVPPDHPDSNYRMTREALLDHVPIRPDRVIRIHGEGTPRGAAIEYKLDIQKILQLEGFEQPVLDLVSLGMGPDGHTASLFPHTEALHELMNIAVANHIPSQKDAWRVTLTWPVINNAHEVFFLIQGEDKARALYNVLLGPSDTEQYPAQLIRPRSGKLTLLLDSAAASLLPKPDANGQGRLEIAL